MGSEGSGAANGIWEELLGSGLGFGKSSRLGQLRAHGSVWNLGFLGTQSDEKWMWVPVTAAGKDRGNLGFETEQEFVLRDSGGAGGTKPGILLFLLCPESLSVENCSSALSEARISEPWELCCLSGRLNRRI